MISMSNVPKESHRCIGAWRTLVSSAMSIDFFGGGDVTKKSLSVLAAAALLLTVTGSALAGSHSNGSGSATHGPLPTGPLHGPSSSSGTSTTHGPISGGTLQNPNGSPTPSPVTKGAPGGHGLPPPPPGGT